jgi:predicted small lipoprotein YifL
MKKRFALAVIVTATMALSLLGCGVKVTNISVPDVY